MISTRLFSATCFAAAFLAPSGSSAQQRQVGGVGITVFADSNFRGKSATIRQQVSDLETLGLNDRISSIRVAPGEYWEVCENVNFKGRCVVVSGAESQLVPGEWDNIISSIRRVATGDVVPPTPGSEPLLVLHDKISFGGNPMPFSSQSTNLADFSNRAQSVTITRGTWQFCDGANFTGECITLNKSVDDLANYGLSRRVSSIRPVTTPPTADWYIVLHSEISYRGNPVNLRDSTANLGKFDNRAQSVTIGRGVWELCEGKNFTGHCVTLDKSVEDLSAYQLLMRVSSVRPKPTR